MAALRRRGARVVLEATSLAEARLGEELEVAAVIAKGHEAGGRVGEATAFILLQELLARTTLPVLAQGGIGYHTAAACYAAGAAGVVLDAQLLLTRECPLSAEARRGIERMEGTETVCVGAELNEPVRLYAKPDNGRLGELREAAAALATGEAGGDEARAAWRDAVRARVGWGPGELWPIGQDAAFARPMAERFRTVGGVLEGMREAVEVHVRMARLGRPFDEGASLARSHGTRFPIVQGPMTRVSDRSAFAEAVARAGALPYLALAVLRGPEVDDLLLKTSAALGERPWGVGILGFVPPELRAEQLEVIARHRPPFALIAGGRPDQALSLEQAGIPTYLHVPSPG
ncbi:MAG: nitronate monooxygenase, partial [Acidimicrobiales bacterium]